MPTTDPLSDLAPMPDHRPKASLDKRLPKPPIETDPNVTPRDRSRNTEAGNKLEGVWSLTQRPLRAVRAAEAGRNGWDALAHGVDRAQAASDDDARYKATGMNHGVSRAALDILEDPASWLGVGLPGRVFQGKSLAAKALDLTEEHGFPAAVRVADRAATALKAHPDGRKIVETVVGAHNNLGVDSAAKRTLARDYGPRWKDEYAARWGNRNRALSEQHELERRLNAELDAAMKGVKPQDRGQVFGAIQEAYKQQSDAPLRALPRELRAAALRYRRVTDARATLQGDESLREFTLRQPSRSPDPLSPAPAAPATPRTGGAQPTTINLGGMGGGIADAMYDRMWADVQKGLTTEAGAPSAMMQLAQQLRAAGRLSSRDDLKHLAGAVQAIKNTKSGPEFQSAMGDLAKTWKAPSTASTAVPHSTTPVGPPRFAGRSKLPKSLQEFDVPAAPRGLQHRSSFIEQYTASAPHDGHGELLETMRSFDAGANPMPPRGSAAYREMIDMNRAASMSANETRGHTVSGLSTENPNLRERTGVPLTDPRAIIAADRRANRNTARSVAAYDAGKRGKVDAATLAMFERTYGDLSAPQSLLKTATDWDKAGIFISPTRHMGNVTALGAIADPLATLQTVAQTGVGAAKKLARRGEPSAARYARQKPAIDAGAVVSEGVERGSPLWDMVGKAPIVGKPLKSVYEASSGALWSYENELANNIFRNKVHAGMKPERAALETREELVDYTNRSPFARGASTVVPFATWRTKAPLAAARLAARNPGRVSAAARTVPALYGGEQPGPFGQSTTSLPFAEAGHVIDDPVGYARGSLGLAGRAVGNVGLNAWLDKAHKNDPKTRARDANWFTYGIPTSKYAAQTLPLVGTGLDITGNGLFDSPQQRRSVAQSVFESQSGVRAAHPVKPKSVRAKREEELLRMGVPWWRVDAIYNAEQRRANPYGRRY